MRVIAILRYNDDLPASEEKRARAAPPPQVERAQVVLRLRGRAAADGDAAALHVVPALCERDSGCVPLSKTHGRIVMSTRNVESTRE